MISASDVERYAYCPLSWHLERKGHNAPSKETLEGTRKHEAMGKSAQEVMKAEDKATSANRYIRIFTILTIMVAIQAAAYAIPKDYRWYIGFVMMVIGLLWGMMATWYYLFLREQVGALEIVNILGVASIVVFLTGVVNLYAYQQDEIVLLGWKGPNFIPLILALMILFAAIFYVYKFLLSIEFALTVRDKATLPTGKIHYTDDGEKARLFISKTNMLSGRPDMIIEREENLIPVEVKTGRVPKGPFFSHILQLAVYCQILEDTESRPPYGLIRYGDKEFQIDFTDDLKELLHEKLGEMRTAMRTGIVHRNHHRDGKCRNCSRKENCPEKLA